MYIFIFIYLHIFWTPQGRVCPFTRYSLNFALAASVCRPQTRNLRWPLHIYPRHSDLVSVSKKKEKEKKKHSRRNQRRNNLPWSRYFIQRRIIFDFLDEQPPPTQVIGDNLVAIQEQVTYSFTNSLLFFPPSTHSLALAFARLCHVNRGRKIHEARPPHFCDDFYQDRILYTSALWREQWREPRRLRACLTPPPTSTPDTRSYAFAYFMRCARAPRH